MKMFYSYVMGATDEILNLQNHGFIIEKEWDNYKISFPSDKANLWEEFIGQNLQVGYWNEYILENKSIVFLFHLEDGIKRYEVFNFQNDEVLSLCEKLCECKFESIYSMLKSNGFYNRFI